MCNAVAKGKKNGKKSTVETKWKFTSLLCNIWKFGGKHVLSLKFMTTLYNFSKIFLIIFSWSVFSLFQMKKSFIPCIVYPSPHTPLPTIAYIKFHISLHFYFQEIFYNNVSDWWIINYKHHSHANLIINVRLAERVWFANLATNSGV